MSYIKTDWTAREGTKLNRFEKQNETSTHVELVNDPETVTETGTPFSVSAMNNIEGALYSGEHGVKTYSDGPADFSPLGQTSRNWRGMTTLGSDVYAAVAEGDIYKQTGGTGDFLPLGQTSRLWRGMTTLDGDVYAVVYIGDIYKQTGGTGDFLPLGQTSRSWMDIASLGNDVYAVVFSGDIYKQTGGTGDFLPLGQTNRGWYALTTLDGDVYAAAGNGGDIYKQTGGTGDFLPLGQTPRDWYAMTTLGNDIYATVLEGDIYKRSGGTGDFLPLGQTSRFWRGLTTLDGDVYAAVVFEDIYNSTRGIFIEDWYTTSIDGDWSILIEKNSPVGSRRKVHSVSGSVIGFPDGERGGLFSDTIPAKSNREYIKASATEWYISSYGGSLYSPITVTADHTISGESEVIVNTDASTTVAITIPSGLPIGTRKKITRIGAYDTTNTNRVRLLPSGTEYITAGQLTDVPIYGNGGTWEIQKVGSLRWEIVGGYDRGSNSNGDWNRQVDGLQIMTRNKIYSTKTFGEGTAVQLEFDVPYPIGSVATSRSRNITHIGTAASYFVCQSEGGTTSWGGRVFMTRIRGTSVISATPNIYFSATGRWYTEV